MSIKETKITLHSVRNLLGESAQLDLFSDQVKNFADEFSCQLSGKIERFGIDLTDMQSRVMEGILRGFNESRFSENISNVEKELICEEKYDGKIPPGYKYVKHVPILKANQSQILQWAGINKNSIASWSRGVEAIDELGTKQFCFYYNRLVFDEKNHPQKDKQGRWVKEEVYTVDTLFTIKKILKNGKLDYYEIYPSSIFLDQQDTYFMFIPFNWREEIKTLVGAKKASSYTFRFIFWLRYQNEMFRRKKKSLPYVIKMTPEEVAIAIKMPESVYKRKVKKAEEILLNAYEVAIQLGYLKSYERKEVEIFVLNDRKFINQTTEEHNEKIITLSPPEEELPQTSEKLLLDLFHTLRGQVDQYHKKPTEPIYKRQLEEFKSLLKDRPVNDIDRAIRWALNKKFWASHTTTPSDFVRNFVKIWTDLSISNQTSKEHRFSVNKNYVQEHLTKHENTKFKNNTQITILSKHIEIGNGPHVSVLSYDDSQFHDKLHEALKKWQISHLLDVQYGTKNS